MRSTAITLTLAAGLALALSQAASAADLPRKAPIAPPPPPAPVLDWTGFYIGGQVGGGWGTTEVDIDRGNNDNNDFFFNGSGFNDVFFPLSSHGLNGFMAGGQIGFNIQNGFWVWGIEGDAAWTDIKGTAPCVVIFACQTKVDFMGTVTARVGFAVDRALIYVKGGGAFAQFKRRVSLFGRTIIETDGDGNSSEFFDGDRDGDDNNVRWGWTVGTGVEYAFLPNWSAKIEYNFMHFDRDNNDFDMSNGTDLVRRDLSLNIRDDIHVVKFGINYKFNWATPVSARY